MQHAILNEETGRLEYVDATPQEVAAIEAERAAAVAEAEVEAEGEANERKLRDALEAAIAKLEQAGAGWPDLTPAQKDAAMRLAVRATAKLARLQLRRLDAVE